MKILVTGGCGFLGSHLVEHILKSTDTEVVILDKLTYASSGFDRLRDISANFPNWGSRVKIIGCDLGQPIPEGVKQEVGDVHYIIHTAAETHVDNSIVDPLPFLHSNVLGTHHLLWWCRELRNLRRVFLVSTDEVYGPAAFGQDVKGFDEQAPFRPANPYAAAKAGGEAVGMAYANTYKLPVTIVNTMNLYGERQHPEKFIPLVIRRVLEGKEVLIHADPSRTQSGTRFYIHCRNFASAIAFLVGHDGSPYRGSDPPLKVHVAGEREIANLDLAQMIAGFIGKPLVYDLVDFHSSRPGHDLRYALDDKMIRDMGWVQRLNTEQALEKTVRWYLDHKKWLGL